MVFIESNLETTLMHLEKLSADTKPLWGKMTAQRMVEHLTDTIKIANNSTPETLILDLEKSNSLKRFLESDKEMAQNLQVSFAPENKALRNEELETAIDEFTDEWLNFEEYFENNPNAETVHPYYGNLNYEQWLVLHSKHLTHHFKQFGLI